MTKKEPFEMRTKFIYIENGRLSLTKEEFERFLEEAYQEGLRDGRSYTYGSVTATNDSFGPSIYYDEKNLSTMTAVNNCNEDKVADGVYVINNVNDSLVCCLKEER
jgi:hypothetical protein